MVDSSSKFYQTAPGSDTAKRFHLKALGCRFGYPGNTDVK